MSDSNPYRRPSLMGDMSQLTEAQAMEVVYLAVRGLPLALSKAAERLSRKQLQEVARKNRAKYAPLPEVPRVTSRGYRHDGSTTHRKPFCANGHEFTAENTIIRKTGKRFCRACARIYAKAVCERRKAEYVKAGYANAKKTHCPHGHEYTPENTRVSNRKQGRTRLCRACEERRDKGRWARRSDLRKRTTTSVDKEATTLPSPLGVECRAEDHQSRQDK